MGTSRGTSNCGQPLILSITLLNLESKENPSVHLCRFQSCVHLSCVCVCPRIQNSNRICVIVCVDQFPFLSVFVCLCLRIIMCFASSKDEPRSTPACGTKTSPGSTPFKRSTVAFPILSSLSSPPAHQRKCHYLK